MGVHGVVGVTAMIKTPICSYVITTIYKVNDTIQDGGITGGLEHRGAVLS